MYGALSKLPYLRVLEEQGSGNHHMWGAIFLSIHPSIHSHCKISELAPHFLLIFFCIKLDSRKVRKVMEIKF